MSLIKNLVKETQNANDEEPNGSSSKTVKKHAKILKSATDVQRLKLEKLMKNPGKPVVIEDIRPEKDFMQTVPTFVRNVMGSSAGAGSGEFHVYRHLRRKEYARQKMIQTKSIKEQLDEEYKQKLEENRRISEEKTAKKRAKRLKKKERAKKLCDKKKLTQQTEETVKKKISENHNDSVSKLISMSNREDNEEVEKMEESSENESGCDSSREIDKTEVNDKQ